MGHQQVMNNKHDSVRIYSILKTWNSAMELILLILKMASGYLLTTFLYERCTANRSRTMFTWWCACPNVVAFIRTVTEFIPPYTCMHLHFRFPCTYENTCHFIRTLHSLSCFGSCCYRLVLSLQGPLFEYSSQPNFYRNLIKLNQWKRYL